MKKQLALTYPHSASLFRFCRRVLDHKFGGVRVIDQDVGQILGFDPADCSHWKKGKKNIHSIYAMRNIAKHLGIDEKLVVDLASGEIDDEEAFCEFLGYGEVEIDAKNVDLAKKNFFKQSSTNVLLDREQEFRNSFLVNESQITKIVSEIHQKIKFEEAPLYLPELAAHYPNLVLQAREDLEASKEGVSTHKDGDTFFIQYKASSDMRPYVRFRIAKALADFFLPKNANTIAELSDFQKQIREVEANLFAGRLLAPAGLVRKEMRNVDVAKDILTQLAEAFWVSKGFMNLRLKEILQS